MAGARSYFSYSVVRSVQSLNPSGDPILTSLKDVQWEILDSSGNPTSGYSAATGPTTIVGGTTDLNGLIEFWADPGLYVIKVTDPSSRIANKNIYWDSVSGQIGGIPGDKIESETITTTQIKNAEVKTADLDSSAVQTAKIADAAITTAKIAPSGVTTDKIDSEAITGAKIAPGTIGQSNIAAGTFVPIGAIMQFAGGTAPANWLLCDGSQQAVSAYPDLDTVLGTTYGARTNGSGSPGTSHFRLPDMRGRVPVGTDNMGTAAGAASRVTSNASRGNTSGSETQSLTTSQIPSHVHPGSIASQGAHTHSGTTGAMNSNASHSHAPENGRGFATNRGFASWYFPGGTGDLEANGGSRTAATNTDHTHDFSIGSSGAHGHTFTTDPNSDNGGSSPTHNNMQPYIVVNYIIRAA